MSMYFFFLVNEIQASGMLLSRQESGGRNVGRECCTGKDVSKLGKPAVTSVTRKYLGYMTVYIGCHNNAPLRQ